MTKQQQLIALQNQVNLLAWLHAELAFKHAGLVHELRTLLAQVAGTTPDAPGTLDAHAQTIRARALRIAQIRAAQIEATP